MTLKYGKTVLLLAAIAFLSMTCSSDGGSNDDAPAPEQPKVADTTYSSVLVNNLRMRSAPNPESETLVLLAQGVVVRTWGERSREKFEAVLRDERVSDYWYRARYEQTEGWVFGGGLQEITEDPLTNLLVIPGQQVGPILSTDTEEDVINRLGSTRTERRTISIGEGETVQGTAVFPGTNKEILLLWQESDFKNLHEVRIGTRQAPWYTESGIRLGLDLKAVEKINETPFMLTGFQWDYAGTTTSWNQGKLSSKLVLVFEEPDRFHKELIGDKSFTSDNARMRRANPIVKRIRILF